MFQLWQARRLVDNCVGMFSDMCRDVCADMHVDMCVDICADVHVEMCVDVCVNLSLEVCADMCVGCGKPHQRSCVGHGQGQAVSGDLGRSNAKTARCSNLKFNSAC